MRMAFAILFVVIFAAPAAFAQDTESIPLEIKGAVFSLKGNAGYNDVKAEIAKILKDEKPSVSSKERIQYDFEAAAGQASMTLVFDFDKTGKLSGVLIDAFAKEQNPTAQALKSWLEKKHGPGKKTGTGLKWTVSGYECVFKEGIDGEDSTYGFAISKAK